MDKDSAVGNEEEEEEMWAWSWGAGTDGQLATGTLQDQLIPQPLPHLAPNPISCIACGGAHAVALTGDGRVLTWGRNKHGQLGHGNLENYLRPKLVTSLENFTVSFVSAGWNHTGFVTDSGRLFMCGDGSFGQLGTGDNQSRGSPVEILFFISKHVEQIACGMRHTIVLVRGALGDSMYGFGAGRRGQIGVPLCARRRSNNLPVVIQGFENCNIVCVCANGDHSAALMSNGQLYTWGRGFCGSMDECIPQILPTSLSFSQVALGWNHALLIAENELYILGGHRHGMLGNGNQVNEAQRACIPSTSCINLDEASIAPIVERVHCLGGERIVHIAAGAEHSALVTEKGAIMTWGWGEHGQLGLGDTCDQTCPQIVNLGYKGSSFCNNFKVYCGSGFTFAVKLACNSIQ